MYYEAKFLEGTKQGAEATGGGGKEGEDATHQVTWSRAPSPFRCDPGHPVKSFDISNTLHYISGLSVIPPILGEVCTIHVIKLRTMDRSQLPLDTQPPRI